MKYPLLIKAGWWEAKMGAWLSAGVGRSRKFSHNSLKGLGLVLSFLALLSIPSLSQNVEIFAHDSLEDFSRGWRDGNLLVEPEPLGFVTASAAWDFPLESRGAGWPEEGVNPLDMSLARCLEEGFSCLPLSRGAGRLWNVSLDDLSSDDFSRQALFKSTLAIGSRVGWTYGGLSPEGQLQALTFWQGDLFSLVGMPMGDKARLSVATPFSPLHLFWDDFQEFETTSIPGQNFLAGGGKRLWWITRGGKGWSARPFFGRHFSPGFPVPLPGSRSFEKLIGGGICRGFLFTGFISPEGFTLMAADLESSPPDWCKVDFLPNIMAPDSLMVTAQGVFLQQRGEAEPFRSWQGTALETAVQGGRYTHQFQLPADKFIEAIGWETVPAGSEGWRLSWRVIPEFPDRGRLPWTFSSTVRYQPVEQIARKLEYRLEWTGNGLPAGHRVSKVWIRTNEKLKEKHQLAFLEDEAGLFPESSEEKNEEEEKPQPDQQKKTDKRKWLPPFTGSSDSVPINLAMAAEEPAQLPEESDRAENDSPATKNSPHPSSLEKTLPPFPFPELEEPEQAEPASTLQQKNHQPEDNKRKKPEQVNPQQERSPENSSPAASPSESDKTEKKGKTPEKSPQNEPERNPAENSQQKKPPEEQKNPEPKKQEQQDVASHESAQKKNHKPSEKAPEESNTPPESSEAENTDKNPEESSQPQENSTSPPSPSLPTPGGGAPPMALLKNNSGQKKAPPGENANQSSSPKGHSKEKSRNEKKQGSPQNKSSRQNAGKSPQHYAGSPSGKRPAGFSPGLSSPTSMAKAWSQGGSPSGQKPLAASTGNRGSKPLSNNVVPKKEFTQAGSFDDPGQKQVALKTPSGAFSQAQPAPSGWSSPAVGMNSPVQELDQKLASGISGLPEGIKILSAVGKLGSGRLPLEENKVKSKPEKLKDPFILDREMLKNPSRALNLAIPLALVLLFLSVVLRYLLKPKKSRFSRRLEEAIWHEKKKAEAARKISRSNREAVKNKPSFTTKWLAPKPGKNRTLVDVVVSGDSPQGAPASVVQGSSLRTGERPSEIPCRILAALPQASSEQRMLYVRDRLFLFSRGQAVFSGRIRNDEDRVAWSEPLALAPESAPGFSVGFHQRWFYFIPGAKHRDSTLIYRAELKRDGKLGQWTEAGSLPFGLGRHALAVTPAGLVLLGGETRKGIVRWTLHLRTDKGGNIIRVEKGLSLPEKMEGIRAAVYRSQLFVWSVSGKATQDLWSCSALADGRFSAWTHRGRLPGSGGGEELFLHKNKQMVLLQGSKIWQAQWRPIGAIEPWRKIRQRTPRHQTAMLLQSDLVFAGGGLTRAGHPLQSLPQALLATSLKEG